MMLKLLFICLGVLFWSTSVLAYDVWNQKEQLPAVGRHRGTGMAIGDKGYAGLGHMNGTGLNIVYSDWWEFDPATNSWSQKADFPVANYGASAFTVGANGYVGGGTGLGSEFYKFSPVTNTWTQIANSLTETPSDDTAFGINDKGYIKSGNVFLEYDPLTDIWTNKASCPLTGWAITSFVIDNKGYVKEGSSLYEYKPSADQWVVRANYPGITTNGGPGFSINNKGYLVTGYSAFLNPVNSECWEYNPSTNSWNQLSDFPGVSRRFGVAFAINNKGYFGLGTNGTNMNDFWEFNPALESLVIESNNSLNFKVYPNPSDAVIYFECSEGDVTNSRVLIYSYTGKLIKEIDNNSTTFELNKNEFNKGVYFYKLISNHSVVTTGKFIFN
jgi:N-acetylneuraminic acid mutarotase